jgi:hypothetical protein
MHITYIAVDQGKSGAIGEAKQAFQSINEPTTVAYNCMSKFGVVHSVGVRIL